MSDPTDITLAEGRFVRLIRRGNWEFVQRKKVTGIVGIVAVTDDRKILLVEQFRPPLGASCIELPAGLAGDVAGSEHEALAVAAQRELLEETGYRADALDEVATGAASAGITDEVLTIFVARGLTRQHDGGGDNSEAITVHEVPLAGVRQWLAQAAARGCVVDLKVYVGLYFAA